MGIRPAAIGLVLLAGAMLPGVPAGAQSTATLPPLVVAPPAPAAAASSPPTVEPPAPVNNGFERVHSQPPTPTTPAPTLTAAPPEPAAPQATPQATPPAQSVANPPAATPEPAVKVAAPAVPAAAPELPPAPALPAFVPAPEPAPAPRPAVAQAIQVMQPKLVSTAKVDANGRMLDLYGVIGQDGEPAQMLQDNVAKTGGTLACTAHGTTPAFDCKMANGTDLALFALVNGVAQVSPDAPLVYQAQENAARDARRGIWSNLPPPPVSLKHPGVYDTATLIATDIRYPLDGIEGAGGELAGNMASYLQAKGDEVLCEPQGKEGKFVCLLTDGTDIATVALVNGAARTAQDAPDNYRLQEADAVKNHRGLWQTVPEPVIQATLRWDATPAASAVTEYAGYGPDPAELADPSDGVAWVGGQPTAVIGAETVFLVYAGAVGWGYYDHERHWHGAPDRFAHHMERFHPEGRGLRGFPERAAFRPGGFERPGFEHAGLARPGFERPGFERPGFERPGFERPGMARPGFERPGFERPGMGRPVVERPVFEHPAFARPGMPGGPMAHPGGPAFARPGMEPHPGMPANFARPGMPGMAAPGMRPGMAQPAMVRPGMPQPAGRPAVLAGRPAAMPMARPMPAAAPRPAPAPRAAPAKSCAKKC